MNKETTKAPSGRVRRQPVGARNKLSIRGAEAGYNYRFVNDTFNRVQEFVDAGYEFVNAEDVDIGDHRVSTPKAVGAKATVNVGRGVTAYVMRQKQDWYEEDQAAKRAKVKETQDAIKNVDKKNGSYGSIRIEQGT